ncbi:MAG: cysteine--tRNA ligase [Thermoplasmata archaeon]|nr:cysteine--tRNA ligase [Thermoplasmata archaeon]
MILIHNTASGKKEELETVESGHVRMYVCGVTVYDDSHIGHARSYVSFDVMRRWLMHRGYRVTYVVNYTDVDDRIIDRSNQTDEPWEVIARRYIASYDEDMDRLNNLRPDITPKATEEIPDMIEAVKTIVDKGLAYEVDGDVYFDIEKGKQWFGTLKHQSIDDMRSGARVEVDERKHNPHDFALWKSSKPGEPSWESPWGKGRPGWHIECSTMSSKYLGIPIDIHGGGMDLIFPHHESENMQTWAIEGKALAKYWIHNGWLMIDEEKMSKSLDNFFTIKEILDRFDPMVLRFFLVHTHYRSPIDFSDANLEEARQAYERLATFRLALERYTEFAEEEEVEGLEEQVEANRLIFGRSMDDDFNTRLAVTQIFELVRIGNQVMMDHRLSKRLHRILEDTFDELTGVLGLEFDLVGGEGASLVAGLVEYLIELRHEARDAKDFEKADGIRAKLKDMGVVLEDGAEGTTWRVER